MADRALAIIIKRLRHRLMWIAGLAGGFWALSAAILCVLIGVWLDLLLELSPILRIASLFAAGLIAVGLFLALGRYALQRSGVAALARRLDTVAGTKGEILSGVELADPKAQSAIGSQPQLTAGMAKMAVNRAVQLAQTVPGKAAVPARPVRRSLTASVVFVATIAAVMLIAPRLAKTQWLRFADPFGDHPPFSRITFNVEPAGTKVIYGEGVEIHVDTDGPPVESLALVFKPDQGQEEELPMFPETDGTWRATIANITSGSEYYVRAGRARSSRYRIGVITVPKIEEVKFHITPPAYTRGATYEGSLPQGGLAGLPGTQVQVTVQSNRPLKRGRLLYTVGESTREIALVPDQVNPTIVRGEVELDAEGNMEIQVIDTDGQNSRETFSTPVVLLDDERPFVRLMQPRELSFATPTAVMPVVIAAEDDYGISRLQLFRNLNDSRHLPMDVAVTDEPPTRLQQVVHLPLAGYGLEPGDEIQLFARVEDNDPTAGPAGKGAESSIVTIRIIPADAFQRSRDGMKLLFSKYQQSQRRLEALANEIKKLRDELKQQPPDSPLSAESLKKLQELTAQMREATQAMEQLVKQQLPYDLDQQLTPKLQEMAEMLQRLEKRSGELADNQNAKLEELQKELDAMLKQLHTERQEAEQEMMQPLQLLDQAVALMADQMRFTILSRKQTLLADRLESLKGRDHEDDPALKARMRDLEEEQQQLRVELEDLVEDIAQHANKLPENDPDYTELRLSALEFVQKLRESGADDAMADAVAGLSEFSGTKGYEAAQQAADILEQFLAQGQGMGKAAGNSLRFQLGGLGQSLSTTAQQLLADAGLNPGNKGGQLGAGGGGYSMRSSTLQNVGLYGGIPTLDQLGNGSGNPTDGLIGSGRSASRGNRGGGATALPGPGQSTNASGGGEAAIPLRYRRKTGRYFQQIADEVGNQ